MGDIALSERFFLVPPKRLVNLTAKHFLMTRWEFLTTFTRPSMFNLNASKLTKKIFNGAVSWKSGLNELVKHVVGMKN